jgi:hypothetical protein
VHDDVEDEDDDDDSREVRMREGIENRALVRLLAAFIIVLMLVFAYTRLLPLLTQQQ